MAPPRLSACGQKNRRIASTPAWLRLLRLMPNSDVLLRGAGVRTQSLQVRTWRWKSSATGFMNSEASMRPEAGQNAPTARSGWASMRVPRSAREAAWRVSHFSCSSSSSAERSRWVSSLAWAGGLTAERALAGAGKRRSRSMGSGLGVAEQPLRIQGLNRAPFRQICMSPP